MTLDAFAELRLDPRGLDRARQVYRINPSADHALENAIAAYLAALRADQKEAAEGVKVKATAQELVDAERRRQIYIEGWTAEHDDRHKDGQMLHAAVIYRANARGEPFQYRDDGAPVGWPWEAAWWKPKDVLSDLIRAGALCVAERDRLERAFKGRASLDYSPGAPASFKLALILGDINLLLSAIQPIPDRGEVEALREALKPFVAQFDAIESRYNKRGGDLSFVPNGEVIGSKPHLTYGDFRRARKALSSGDTRS